MSKRALLLAAIAALVLCSTAAGAGLRTALNENGELERPTAELFAKRVRAAGATMLRLPIPWAAIAITRPADATNPEDAAYDWSGFDAKIKLLDRYGIDPIVVLEGTPDWAAQEGHAPRPKDAAEFATAAATHYGGRTPGIPRIRYWQVMNEPNVNFFFAPPYKDGKPYSPLLYRAIVNAVGPALHDVRADNVVIAGGLSPFTVTRGETRTIGPLAFMRSMLCMSKGAKPKRTCRTRVPFDVWAAHPYTSGGPTHHAFNPDDVSLGDLPEMSRLLRSAVAARQVASSRRVRFWVTEFSWDTKPPDPGGLPLGLHARWVSQALYVMWKAGIDVVTWLQLRDDPFARGTPVQSGLWFRGRTMQADKPKPALQAFRFPFVALHVRRGTVVWGRTPTSRRSTVVIEQRTGSHGRWRGVAKLRAKSGGIFTTRLGPTPTRGAMRARVLSPSAKSRAFSLVNVPDRFVRPFGA